MALDFGPFTPWAGWRREAWEVGEETGELRD